MEERDLASDFEFWSGRTRSSAMDGKPERPRKPYRRSRFGRLPFRLPFRRPSFELPRFRRPSFRRPFFRRAQLAIPSFARKPAVGDHGRALGRARPVAAALLLAGLTSAWLIVAHQSHGSAAPGVHAIASPSTRSAASTSPPPTSAPPAAPPTNAIGRASVDRTGCVGLSVTQPHLRCGMTDYVGLEEVALYTPATVGGAFRSVSGPHVSAGSGPAACASGRSDERAWSIASAPQYAVGRYLCRFESGRAAMWWTHGDRLLHVLSNDADLAKLFSWWRAHPSE